MKIILLASASSIHTIRWANGLSSKGYDVHLISLHKCKHTLSKKVKLYLYSYPNILGSQYFLSFYKLRVLIKKINPNIINCHYASGYGLLGRLIGIKPFVLSIWGSDVYTFPQKSILHYFLIKKNFIFADAFISTSHAMKNVAKKIFNNSNIFVVPFGVDTKIFKPINLKKNKYKKNKIIIGTVKTLEKIYGIDILIKSFAIAWHKLKKPDNLFLEIVGEGSQYQNLVSLSKSLGISHQVIFCGFVKPKNIPKTLNRFDVYCALSLEESFGVSILEASSCKKPVVVSDADGPSEVVLNGITGLIVPRSNVKLAAMAILKLIKNKRLREKLGKNGRLHVLKNYNWKNCLDSMIKSYKIILKTNFQK